MPGATSAYLDGCKMMSGPARSLSSKITEPDNCSANGPPVSRCPREPESGTVAAISGWYGMVFKLDLGHCDYFTRTRSEAS